MLIGNLTCINILSDSLILEIFNNLTYLKKGDVIIDSSSIMLSVKSHVSLFMLLMYICYASLLLRSANEVSPNKECGATHMSDAMLTSVVSTWWQR